MAILGRGGQLAHLSDPAVCAAAIACIAGEMDLRLNTQALSMQADGDGVTLQSRDGAGRERSERYDYVLAATGRVPHLNELELQHSGLTLDARGVPLFDRHTMQCGDSSIFIAGDVDQERPVLHEAADQGRIAGDNAGRYPALQPGLRRTALSIAFTDPQIAKVGAAHRDLKPGSFAIGQVAFEDQGRSRVMLQNRGLLRVYGEFATQRLLGAEMLGPRAEHLAHLLAWACQTGMTIPNMLQMPFYHPVIEEGLRSALRDLAEKLLHGLPEIEHCTDCTPGV